MSLEVDGRSGGVPIPHQHESEAFKYPIRQDTYDKPSPSQDPYTTGTPGAHSPHQQPPETVESGQGGRLRVSIGSISCWWFLSILVAVLAIVVAGVLGSVAAKTKKHLDTCTVTLQGLTATLNAKDSSDGNKSHGTENSTGTANTTCRNSDAASFIPTSDCTSLASPYTPQLYFEGIIAQNNSFNIHCDTDYPSSSLINSVDFMSFLAFTFEDCIVGCASYNQRVPSLHPNSTCYAVSFINSGGENHGPTCWLKGAQNLVPKSSPGETSSALLITNG
ncbi:hypothetical protein BDR22DRAFT_964574 [Usnea florida]